MGKTKRIAAFVLSVLTCLSFTLGVCAEEQGLKLDVDAKGALIMEAHTGKVLYEHNPDERLPLASVTKVMTMLLIYEALADERVSLDDVVTISDHAAGMGGSQIYLEPMEKQTVRDLLKSVVVASANDAAVALAEFVSGSEESFVDLMNRRAKELGMENTGFKNACGLDEHGHFSSARDVALMSAELITKHSEVFDYTKIWQDSIVHKTARGEEEFGLTNTNKLIRWYNGATGLKTGSTSQALYCLSGTADRDGFELIAVVLGSPNPNLRFQEVMQMFDYGYANYKIARGSEKGSQAGTVKVSKGLRDEVETVVKDDVYTVIPKTSSAELTSETTMTGKLDAPVLKGDKAGEIVYTYDGKEIGRTDIVTIEDVPRAGILDIMKKLKPMWFK